MIVLNQGTEYEITLRVVLSSEAYGNEYFDHYDTIEEALEGIKNLVYSSVKEGDALERIIGIAIVPKDQYGAEDGYGFSLDGEDELEDEDELTPEQEAVIRALYARSLVAGDGDKGESEHSAQRMAAEESIDTILELLDGHPELDSILRGFTIEVGGQYVFRSTEREAGGQGRKERSGETVSVVRPLTEAESDVPMFLVRFADGTEAHVFSDELSPVEGN